MTTPNTTGPSDEIQRYHHSRAVDDVFASKNGKYVLYSDHLDALSRAREESRREALEEMKPMRDLVAELTALDFGCISGDCPHEHRDECRVFMEGQMKQIAREARSYFHTPHPHAAGRDEGAAAVSISDRKSFKIEDVVHRLEAEWFAAFPREPRICSADLRHLLDAYNKALAPSPAVKALVEACRNCWFDDEKAPERAIKEALAAVEREIGGA